MTRFKNRPTPVVNTAIVLSMMAIFMTDLYTPLGIAIWLFYLLPLVLSYFVWQPIVPLAIAGATTLLTLLTYFLSPPGGDYTLVAWNRALGMVMVWTLGAMGYQFISNKLAVQKQEWLQSGKMLLNQNMAGD